MAGSYNVRILADDGQTVLATVASAITANDTDVAHVSFSKDVL